jgi:DNA-binding CsgD family transcriptional regulator
MIFGFIIFPLMALFLYFYIQFTLELSGKKKNKIFHIAYLVFWAIYFILFIVAEYIFFNKGISKFIKFLMNFFDVSILLPSFIAVILLYINSRNNPNIYTGKLGKIIAIYYFTVNCYFANDVYSLIPFHLNKMQEIFFSFSFNLPPLIFIFFLIQKIHIQKQKHTGLSNLILKKFSTKNISDRELELIKLIVEGKTNAEISEALYISLRTVETHIYNIYKKLKIKNRVQLMNIIFQK